MRCESVVGRSCDVADVRMEIKPATVTRTPHLVIIEPRDPNRLRTVGGVATPDEHGTVHTALTAQGSPRRSR